MENIVLVLRSGICGFYHTGKIKLTCYQVFQGIEILLIINMVVSLVHYSTQSRLKLLENTIILTEKY